RLVHPRAAPAQVPFRLPRPTEAPHGPGLHAAQSPGDRIRERGALPAKSLPGGSDGSGFRKGLQDPVPAEALLKPRLQDPVPAETLLRPRYRSPKAQRSGDGAILAPRISNQASRRGMAKPPAAGFRALSVWPFSCGAKDGRRDTAPVPT